MSQSLPSGIGLFLDSSCCGGDPDGVSVPQEHELNVRTVGIPEKKMEFSKKKRRTNKSNTVVAFKVVSPFMAHPCINNILVYHGDLVSIS